MDKHTEDKPMINPEWKQKDPKDQATAILAALMWDIELLELYPCIPNRKTLNRMKDHILKMKTLAAKYLKENW